MTIPDLPPDRPVPDTSDLRLLAELIANAFIPLANAAWNAQMSQTEAALRLVTMAERGLPLRLVADGDRQALWSITQAGPATGGVPVTGAPEAAHAAAQASPADSPEAAAGIAPAAPFSQPHPAVPPAAPFSQPQPAVPPAAPFSQPHPAMPPAAPFSQPQPAMPPAAIPAAPSSAPLPTVSAAGPPIAPSAAPDSFVPAGSGPVPVLPPAPPVPPHEQAIAGAVPLGQPPFGQPEPPAPGPVAAADAPSPSGITLGAVPAMPAAPPVPTAPDASSPSGTPFGAAPAIPPLPNVPSPDATVVLGPEFQPSGPVPVAPVPAQDDRPAEPFEAAAAPAPTPAPAQEPELSPDAASSWGVAGSSSWARAEDAPAPAPEPRHWASLPVAGPAGEQLLVTIVDVVDPGDQALTDAGYRMEPGQRAVLVRSTVANTGQVPYYPVGDLNLVLETDRRTLLGRANVAVATHPAFPVGVAPGRTAEGWSVFFIAGDTALAGLKWCIRPDMPQTILSWPIAP